jgi:hypothetical protein
MLGVELLTDRKEKTPAKAETAILFEKLRGNEDSLPTHKHGKDNPLTTKWFFHRFLMCIYHHCFLSAELGILVGKGGIH